MLSNHVSRGDQISIRKTSSIRPGIINPLYMLTTYSELVNQHTESSSVRLQHRARSLINIQHTESSSVSLQHTASSLINISPRWKLQIANAITFHQMGQLINHASTEILSFGMWVKTNGSRGEKLSFPPPPINHGPLSTCQPRNGSRMFLTAKLHD